ncbi:MAG: glycosyltransferase family 4 protein [Odoribacter sp.]|nr:glycosyltransferase family 4 protein [Odoribacter sp.]
MKIKILFVFHNADLNSGASKSLFDIICSLAAADKYNMQAVLPNKNPQSEKMLQALGIKTYTFKYGNLMQNLQQPKIKRMIKIPIYMKRYLSIKREADKAAHILAAEHIDIVYSNTSSIIFGGLLGRKLNCKQMWHIREFRDLDHRIAFFLGDRYLKRFINSCAAAVLFVSKSVRDAHKDLIDENKMFVTYNSYPKSFICPKSEFNYDKPLHILLAGDIKPSKGQLEAVQAAAAVLSKYPGSAVLHLAGRCGIPAYEKKIKQCMSQSGIDDYVILHGQVKDMLSLRKNMDVGIVSSTNEAFGRTTIEGMLSMMTMIGRASGGTVEQIKDRKTGLLYDGTVKGLADCIEYLLINRSEMERMARTAFDESIKLYTDGKCAQVAEEAIEFVLSSK